MNPQLAARAVARRPQRRWGLVLPLALALALPGAALAQKKRRAPAAQKQKAPSAPAERRGARDDGASDGGTRDGGARDGSARDGAARGAETGQGKVQVFDFAGLELQGSMRTPQLLYFLGRAREELRRASLERRSFVPEMVRSLEEAPL